MPKFAELLNPKDLAKVEEIKAEFDRAEEERRQARIAAEKHKYETGGYFTSAEEIIDYVMSGKTIYGSENFRWGHLEPDQMRRVDGEWVARFGQNSYDDATFWFGWTTVSLAEWRQWVYEIAKPEHLEFGKYLPIWHRDENRTPYKYHNGYE